jgi:polyisoprenyl-phosphate glycosyltransferase
VPFISVITPCFNEEQNIELIYRKVREAIISLPGYHYEHIFIDNDSKDSTVQKLEDIAANDKNVKVIINTRNFGQIRSPYYALLQAQGEAVIGIVADLQDPPELIKDFIRKWEDGYEVVIGIKKHSRENGLMFFLRTLYYKILGLISNVDLIEHFTGYGLYDRKVIEELRALDNPYPYFRGLIAELGYDYYAIEYTQPVRYSGKTKNNFFTLYELAMLGLTNHSKVPLRIASMIGFLGSAFSVIVAIFYFVYKIIFWNSFSLGLAPIVVGLFLFSSVQLFFLGIVGEYIGAIYTHIRKVPLVVEKRRINF